MGLEGQDSIENNISSEKTVTIPVIEEKLRIDTARIETGKVLVSKKVSEEEAFFDGIVEHNEVSIDRKAINQYVEAAPPAVRQEGDVTIISVMKEVLVVEKRLMLVEEVHITRHQRREKQAFSETLKKEEVVITRDASGTDV